MRLGFEEAPTPFSSPSQSARVWTESWVRKEVYCPNCGQSNIEKYPNNQPVADFFCSSCKEDFELKSQKNQFSAKVTDGAFGAMCKRLASGNNPNLLLLNYDLKQFGVTNLFVVPKHFFVREIIEERPPLAPTARRAGWVGCNIRLDHVPKAGKIFLVRDGQPLPKDDVLTEWNRTLFLREERAESRGWLIEVMKCVDQIGRSEFELSDVYAFEDQLRRLYPNNRHIKEKIRQQLQVLRDQGYLQFLSRGLYRLRASGYRG
jgi:type II restriction enzyme